MKFLPRCAGGMLFAVLAVLQGASPPPDWTFRLWEADDGLLDNRITGLAQSADGSLWISTLGGVLRFDGASFEEFHLSAVEGVIGNGARAMYFDSHDTLWLSAYRESLLRVGPDSARFYTGSDGIPAGPLHGRAEDREGTAWLAIGSVVGKLAGDRFVPLILPGVEAAGGRAALATGRDGRIWCALGGQVGLLQGSDLIERTHLGSPEVVMTPARAGGVWVWAGRRLYHIASGRPPRLATELPEGTRPSSLLEEHTGAVWVGTLAHGLYRFGDSGLQPVEVSHQQVSALLEDREGNIWAGTFGGGLNRLRPRAIELLGTESGLPSTSVTSVCQDQTGAFWAATITGHLVRGEGTSWRLQPTDGFWSGDSAACVATDRRGRLWVGTRGQGLQVMNLTTRERHTWRLRDEVSGNTVRSLFVAADDAVWFSTSGRPGGFYCIADGNLRKLLVPPDVRNIRSIVQDTAGVIWAGTSSGQVLRVAGDALVPDPGLKSAITTSVRCLHTTSDGSLWISYAEQSLAHYQNGHYTLFTKKDPLVPDIVSQMASDQSGNLWLAGSLGLYKLPAAALAALAEGQTDKPRATFFRRTEGLPNLQPHYDNSPSVCLARDGRLLFSTTLGLLTLNPANLPDNPLAPAVLLGSVSVDDRLVALRQRSFPLREGIDLQLAELARSDTTLVLAPGHFRLNLKFSALSYTAPENVLYQYRMAGLEESWSEPGNSGVARYSRLPAGAYRFEVMGCNEAGVWSKSPTTLAITVSPFIWQTWWFRLTGAGVFTAAVVFLVRLVSFRRLQSRLKRSEQREALFQERTRIARDIHDDLGGSLAHIKLLSEIAVQDSRSAAKTEVHLHQITAATQRVMKSLNETIWAINPGNDTVPHLVSYLGQHAVEFLRAAGISCEVDLPENPPETQLSPEVRHNLFLTVKEALTNVVRHSGASRVRLGVHMKGGTLSIRIEDNGRGFASSPADPHADGLGNMRQRMESLDGSFRIESLPGSGTTIQLEMEINPPFRSRRTFV